MHPCDNHSLAALCGHANRVFAQFHAHSLSSDCGAAMSRLIPDHITCSQTVEGGYRSVR